jgi:hypothetical protein
MKKTYIIKLGEKLKEKISTSTVSASEITMSNYLLKVKKP